MQEKRDMCTHVMISRQSLKGIVLLQAGRNPYHAGIRHSWQPRVRDGIAYAIAPDLLQMLEGAVLLQSVSEAGGAKTRYALRKQAA